eukprot:4227783-Pyramimonas_sp.AAC.1
MERSRLRLSATRESLSSTCCCSVRTQSTLSNWRTCQRPQQNPTVHMSRGIMRAAARSRGEGMSAHIYSAGETQINRASGNEHATLVQPHGIWNAPFSTRRFFDSDLWHPLDQTDILRHADGLSK